MSILTLSGWGQPHDALKNIAPSAQHFDYTAYPSASEAMHALAQAASGVETIIGWSLGGQLAVRAIAAGMMKPKKLILIAVPFQFVESAEIKLGMKRDQFDKFRDNYAKDATRTLKKAWELVVKNDANEQVIREYLNDTPTIRVIEKPWLRWLDELHGFTCNDLNFSEFPDTILFHGDGDVVVEHAQSHAFAQRIAHAKHITVKNCGHAPHWHDEGLFDV